MPEQHSYTTSLVISGQIDPKLIASIKGLCGENAKVATQIKELGKESKENFKLMETGVEGAKKGVETLKEALKELLLPVTGVLAVFSSVKGIFGELDKSADVFEELEDKAANFKALLSSTGWAQKHDKEGEALFEAFKKQAEEAKDETGKVFGEAIWEGIQGALVKTAALGPKATSELLGKIPEVVAEMGHGLKSVTAESTEQFSTAVGLFVKTGMLRNAELRRSLGATPQQMAMFRKMTAEQREQFILNSKTWQGADRYWKNLQQNEPKLFEIRRMDLELEEKRLALGGKYLATQQDLKIIGLELQSVFDDLLTEVVAPLLPTINAGLHAAESGVKQLGGWITWLFKHDDNESFAMKLKNTFVNLFPEKDRKAVWADIQAIQTVFD